MAKGDVHKVSHTIRYGKGAMQAKCGEVLRPVKANRASRATMFTRDLFASTKVTCKACLRRMASDRRRSIMYQERRLKASRKALEALDARRKELR